MVGTNMRSIDRKFYESKTWRDCQKAYMTKVNHLCERCLARGRYEPAVVVHHRVHLTEENYGNAELTYGFDNLEALCLACHNDEHGRTKIKRRWKFVEGELVTKPDAPHT